MSAPGTCIAVQVASGNDGVVVHSADRLDCRVRLRQVSRLDWHIILEARTEDGQWIVSDWTGGHRNQATALANAGAWLQLTEPKQAGKPNMPVLKVYTDGSCNPNPGPGGYGVVILLPDGTKTELSGGYRATTNNRMETLAVIKALEYLPEYATHPTFGEAKALCIFSDSQYVVDTIEKGWAKKWKQDGWQRKTKSGWLPAKNPDLWERMLNLLDGRRCYFHWVRSHVGEPNNERADELAKAATARMAVHGVDVGYETPEVKGNTYQ